MNVSRQPIKPEVLPGWHDPLFTMGQAGAILGRPRSTLAGHIARYKSLRIESVVAGSTRRLSLGQLTALCLVRQMVASTLSPTAIEGSIDPLRNYAADLFGSVENTGFGYDADVRRNGEYHRTIRQYSYDFEFKFSGATPKMYATYLAAAFGSEEPQKVSIGSNPMDRVGSWRDLQGFPLPSVTLPLDDILIRCWSRALTIANGHDPDA